MSSWISEAELGTLFDTLDVSVSAPCSAGKLSNLHFCAVLKSPPVSLVPFSLFAMTLAVFERTSPSPPLGHQHVVEI